MQEVCSYLSLTDEFPRGSRIHLSEKLSSGRMSSGKNFGRADVTGGCVTWFGVLLATELRDSSHRIASRCSAMICACQMRPTDIRLKRKMQTARAKLVWDSRAGKRKVRMSQDMYGSPSTQMTFRNSLNSKHFFGLEKCNSVAKRIQIIHTVKSRNFLG